MRHNKIKVKKVDNNRLVPNRVGAIKRPIKTVEVKKTTNKPKIVIKPVKKSESKQQQQRLNNRQIVENVKKGKRKIVLAKKPIRKDANYQKISELKNSGVDKILIMLACGPSVLENDFSKLNNIDNIDIMVINKPLESVWPPKYWAFCDQSQYKRNKNTFNTYDGILINSSAVLARKQNQIIIQAKSVTGVSRNLHEGYVIGSSSVYANIQVALWMNYQKIFIFGVDMCEVGGKLHHYGVNPDVPEEKRKQRFQNESKHYDRMAAKLPDNLRNKIYFCSSYNQFPFVEKFNKWDHKSSIPKILEISQSIS